MANKFNNMDLMGSSSAANLKSLFNGLEDGQEEEMKIVNDIAGEYAEIDVLKLKQYHLHTFSIKKSISYQELTDSIRSLGIIVPLIVQKVQNGNYEIIMGHRRASIAKALGLKTVPCKIVNIPDYKADQYMTDTNINRRDDEILPSERAAGLKVKFEALRKQWEVEGNKNTAVRDLIKKMSLDTGMSENNIYKYRALLNLNKGLLDLVDDKKISIQNGYKLSNLDKQSQEAIIDAGIDSIDSKQCELIITAASHGQLTAEIVKEILGGKKLPRKTKTSAKFTEKSIVSHYPASIKKLEPVDRERFVIDCIKAYMETHDKWENRNI